MTSHDITRHDITSRRTRCFAASPSSRHRPRTSCHEHSAAPYHAATAMPRVAVGAAAPRHRRRGEGTAVTLDDLPLLHPASPLPVVTHRRTRSRVDTMSAASRGVRIHSTTRRRTASVSVSASCVRSATHSRTHQPVRTSVIKLAPLATLPHVPRDCHSAYLHDSRRARRHAIAVHFHSGFRIAFMCAADAHLHACTPPATAGLGSRSEPQPAAAVSHRRPRRRVVMHQSVPLALLRCPGVLPTVGNTTHLHTHRRADIVTSIHTATVQHAATPSPASPQHCTWSVAGT